MGDPDGSFTGSLGRRDSSAPSLLETRADGVGGIKLVREPADHLELYRLYPVFQVRESLGS